MTLAVPFTGDMPDGALIQLFYSIPAGIPVSGPGGPTSVRTGLIGTANVVAVQNGNQAVFTNIQGPFTNWTPAFCGFFQGTFIWHAFGDLKTVSAGFMVLSPANFPAVFISASKLADLVQNLPASFGSVTATPGNGEVTLAGTATVNGIPVKFTYVFSLSPAQCGDLAISSASSPNLWVPVIVNTISTSIEGDNDTWFAFLINPFIDLFLPLFEPNVQNLVQSEVNENVQNQLGSVPTGTTATITNITITSAGIALQGWLSIPMASNCSGTISDGSVKFRSADQVSHLRKIRDGLLRRSPEGAGYISMLKQNNTAIMTVLMKHPDLLKHADAFVEKVLKDFPQDAPENGRLSASAADSLVNLMDRFVAVAPKDLALVVQAVKTQVKKFVGQSAAEVLDRSWSLLGQSQDL
ncbi:MAG: hypothetical protein WB579_21820 [Bryobacteraceae bacterium]